MQHLSSGKVRDLYALDDGHLLLVASDRISAYDHVLPTHVPDKGHVLTAMSLWWFSQLSDLVPNHVVTGDLPPDLHPSFTDRSIVCERLAMFPVECVVRGYLAGSALVDYRATGQVCGVALPPGLREGDRLPEPVFTPATKAAVGAHDENVDLAAVADAIGADEAAALRDLSLAVYARAEAVTRERGLLLADTKLEFGRRADGTIVLADEVLTPDSSRYWPADGWEPGRAQPSYDKQYVRDWLTSPASGWDRHGDAPPPALPAEVVARTRAKYVEAYELVTGLPFG